MANPLQNARQITVGRFPAEQSLCGGRHGWCGVSSRYPTHATSTDGVDQVLVRALSRYPEGAAALSSAAPRAHHTVRPTRLEPYALETRQSGS